MINRIEILIYVNLKLLYNSKNKSVNISDFKDEFEKKLDDPYLLIEIMQNRDLIYQDKHNLSYFTITEKGFILYENKELIANQKKSKKLTALMNVLTIKKYLFTPEILLIVLLFATIIILFFMSR